MVIIKIDLIFDFLPLFRPGGASAGDLEGSILVLSISRAQDLFSKLYKLVEILRKGCPASQKKAQLDFQSGSGNRFLSNNCSLCFFPCEQNNNKRKGF